MTCHYLYEIKSNFSNVKAFAKYVSYWNIYSFNNEISAFYAL